MILHSNFRSLILQICEDFHHAKLVTPPNWQGKDVSKSTYMQTYELLNYNANVVMPWSHPWDYHEDIRPDLPWADDHFEERVCGYPLNPGTQWKLWRHGKGADQFREPDGRFNHNYMERFWPKFARKVPPSEVPNRALLDGLTPHRGIYYEYGDLEDLVRLLKRDPETRQAVLPMFFPEDTGTVHGGRAPCSLTWQFMVRDGYMHCTYNLRSCDAVNHMRNDLYFAVRMVIWILVRLRARDETGYWNKIVPGIMTMNVMSLHAFRGEINQVLEYGL